MVFRPYSPRTYTFFSFSYPFRDRNASSERSEGMFFSMKERFCGRFLFNYQLWQKPTYKLRWLFLV